MEDGHKHFFKQTPISFTFLISDLGSFQIVFFKSHMKGWKIPYICRYLWANKQILVKSLVIVLHRQDSAKKGNLRSPVYVLAEARNKPTNPPFMAKAYEPHFVLYLHLLYPTDTSGSLGNDFSLERGAAVLTTQGLNFWNWDILNQYKAPTYKDPGISDIEKCDLNTACIWLLSN